MKTSRTPTTKPRSSSTQATDARRSTAEELAATSALSAAERHRRIAERAYLRAAARDFAGDHELDDWLAAEREIDDQTVAPGAS